MDNKNRNVKPGDSEIVTKKGFLITPPGKKAGKKPDAQKAQAENSGKDKPHAGNRKNGFFNKKKAEKSEPSNQNGEQKNNEKRAQTAPAGQNKERREDDKNRKDGGAKGGKNRNGKNGKKHFDERRDNRRNERADDNGAGANENTVNTQKNDKNQKKAPRDKNNDRDRNAKKSSGVLGELGFVSDSFLKKSKTTTVIEDEQPEKPIDYSKAVPLREQIYGNKPQFVAEESTDGKLEIIGVRFKEAGKIYYFDPSGTQISYGTPVIVETARGLEYGFTAISNRYIPVDTIVAPLKKIVRVATREDKERLDANKMLEKDAAGIFNQKVEKLGLEMSLVGVEYTFDNTKLLFYFVAEGRVDFRELVKELAAVFHTRIELRQVGVRDEAKMMGGLGVCGRPLCCNTFLGEFAQVSIKMAKDQNLSLNSAKISGTCGRLLCCLRYEDEVYQKEYERTPKVDAIVETPEGKGTVVEANPLKGIVRVRLDDRADAVPQAFHRDSVKILGYHKKNNDEQVDSEILKLEE